MATRVIDDTKLNNIAVAIQSKDNGGQMTVDEMPGRIQAIPTGVPVVLNPALVLWDWEGTKLAEYSRHDALALSALPAPSSLPFYATADHELLVFQGWNRSLANIKTWIQNHEGECLGVGTKYTTTDGQDHNYWGNPRLSDVKLIKMQKRGTTSISASAFQNCYSLTQLNIPDGVTSIGNNAFYYCYSLTQLNIPDSVTSISNNAFNNCYSLTQLNIPDGVTSISASAFQNCYSLTQLNIPDGVTSIDTRAFQNCYSLTQLNIPDGVTSIGNYAFQNCKTLCDILNESQAALADVSAFTGLPSNYRIYVPRADLSWHETATNWATIYTQGHIVAIEDNIAYLESIGFNVDAYKGA